MNIEVNISEKIINKLREAKIPLNKGASIARITKEIGVSDHIYYRCRKEYGGMKVDQEQCLKEVEQENHASRGWWLMPFLLRGRSLEKGINS